MRGQSERRPADFASPRTEGFGPGADALTLLAALGYQELALTPDGSLAEEARLHLSDGAKIKLRAGVPLARLAAPEDEPEAHRLISAGGRAVLRLAGADGEWRAFEVARLNGPDEQLRLALRDITAEHLRREALTHAERACRFGDWHYRIEGRRLTISRGFLALFGLEESGGAIGPMRLFDFMDEKERRQTIRSLIKGRKNGQPFTLLNWVTLKDGRRKLLSSDVIVERNRRGTALALKGLTRDISELAFLDRDRRHEENQARLVTDYATDIIARADDANRAVFVSPAVEQVLGYRPEAFIGKLLTSFIHADDRHHFQGLRDRWATDPAPARITYRCLHAAGHYVWLETVIRPLMDLRRKRLLGTIAVSRDVTERKNNEDALMLARERAEIANKAKSRFLANMSHELRTPLNAIIGFSEIIKGEMFGALGSERYSEYAGLIHESGRLLLDLINDLLDMAKIEAGRYTLTPEELDLAEVAQAATRLLAQQAAAKSLTLRLGTIEHQPELIADQRAVKQIMINLLSNAIKFTPSGGLIEVMAEESEKDVTLIVRDTGIGIPEAAMSRIARPFEQAHGDLHVTHGGTGLGLALVQSLARLHGGDLAIESAEGKGTTVRVTLPRLPVIQPQD